MVGAHPVAPYPAQHRHSPPDTIITAKPGDSGMLVSPEHLWQEMGGEQSRAPPSSRALAFTPLAKLSPRGDGGGRPGPCR